MKETKGRSEVTVFMSQAGGIGSQASFTGPDATKILQRLSEFPGFVNEHPVGYEVELATYDTIPIPVPTPEEHEDRQIVLQDCFAQKMGLLKALSTLTFVLGDSASLFFDNLPPEEDLVKIQGQYRTTLNALMAHAIRVSTGKMAPPQTFVANPAPPPLNFKKRPFSPEPKTVELPNFVLMNINVADANHRLADLGLVGSIGRRPDAAHVGIVISQDPPGGTVQKGSMVTLLAGMGDKMPDETAMRLLTEDFSLKS
jgi:hypothetical protein